MMMDERERAREMGEMRMSNEERNARVTQTRQAAGSSRAPRDTRGSLNRCAATAPELYPPTHTNLPPSVALLTPPSLLHHLFISFLPHIHMHTFQRGINHKCNTTSTPLWLSKYIPGSLEGCMPRWRERGASVARNLTTCAQLPYHDILWHPLQPRKCVLGVAVAHTYSLCMDATLDMRSGRFLSSGRGSSSPPSRPFFDTVHAFSLPHRHCKCLHKWLFFASRRPVYICHIRTQHQWGRVERVMSKKKKNDSPPHARLLPRLLPQPGA